MEVPASGSQEPEKNAPIEVNNINRIILNTLCAEGLRKIKFVLHVLRELLQKKTNILHVYITNDIGHLSTESSRKKVFQTLQEGIELCENESDYDAVKTKIEEYINALSETNEILCQNSPADRNLKDNRNKIIEDGSLLLNIFLKMKRLNFASVVKELDAFKEEQNLLLNLQNVHDELVEYYQKERRKRMQRLEKIKNEFKDSLRAIQLKREQIATYDQVNKQREEEEKEKMRREIDEREHLKKHSEYILFLQDVARSKIKDYEERRRRKMRKNAAKKKKK
ncbi:hypothetical protein, conserved [Plasmodium vivax]|uniref:Uncharacterized protein n=2 Tax=Plasmodium vivax TaxID=5855 RepID=A5K4X1_PLAVS|nr:hypothetical protein, conserved [Plasmodium vivax]EDL45699.1 hypothetical protein, conserved [Plasmodium vivax]KMZ93113.1 hypothetical protein PVMG_04263 [Plasmodium vivax Mauritania I]|eukprot:XP_001615426.1 hypothetical protein [Plasmodium vivax Sal-1]